MVTENEKRRLLILLNKGDQVTIMRGDLSAELWTKVCRAMPFGSSIELIAFKIKDVKILTHDAYMLVNFSGTEIGLPYTALNCQAIDTLERLVTIDNTIRGKLPMIDFNADMRVDTKMMAAVFGVPERLVDDFTVGYTYSGV